MFILPHKLSTYRDLWEDLFGMSFCSPFLFSYFCNFEFKEACFFHPLTSSHYPSMMEASRVCLIDWPVTWLVIIIGDFSHIARSLLLRHQIAVLVVVE